MDAMIHDGLCEAAVWLAGELYWAQRCHIFAAFLDMRMVLCTTHGELTENFN